jgi:hypothetical protein
VGVGVDVMVLGEHVGDGVEDHGGHQDHTEDDLGVGDLVSSKESDVFRNIMGHLRGRRWGSIIVFDHTVMELRRHGDNHVIEVRVKVATFRYINTERSRVVVSSQEIVRIVVETRVHGGSL